MQTYPRDTLGRNFRGGGVVDIYLLLFATMHSVTVSEELSRTVLGSEFQTAGDDKEDDTYIVKETLHSLVTLTTDQCLFLKILSPLDLAVNLQQIFVKFHTTP